MIKIEHGFSAIEGLLVIVVLVVIGGVGYTVLNRGHKTASVDKTATTHAATQPESQTAATDKPLAPVGTTESIDSLTTQDINSESSIDSAHSASEQATDQNANSAAANIGGAYNESAL